MEYVVALRKIEEIEAMKKQLLAHSARDHLLFVFGINTGMKLSEMLPLKKKDVYLGDNQIVTFLTIYAERGEEYRDVFMNDKVKAYLLDYLKSSGLHDEDYLFFSPKTKKPISRQQAYRVIHDAALHTGLSEKIGTHTMRKTFGYHAYKQGVAISLLQKIFHHSTKGETLKYIGISKEESIQTEIDVHL
ncbi:tyrosine-type recombinase/integrase [Bacillus sp. 1P06AnD]|uniref:tyrosine-type recombinase/integrase n=1 Tax=Bacillus sp. 1P06AnD TaxID=3132208 RepID=UPI0039A086D8